MILPVYSFTCDRPRCDEDGWEVLPLSGTGLQGALRELKAHGWTVRGREQFCPKHPPQEG
jgi:hypothetical protein